MATHTPTTHTDDITEDEARSVLAFIVRHLTTTEQENPR